MKSLKIWTLSFALCILGLSNSFAQTTDVSFSEEQKEQMAQAMEQYTQALDLSNEQKTRV